MHKFDSAMGFKSVLSASMFWRLRLQKRIYAYLHCRRTAEWSIKCLKLRSRRARTKRFACRTLWLKSCRSLQIKTTFPSINWLYNAVNMHWKTCRNPKNNNRLSFIFINFSFRAAQASLLSEVRVILRRNIADTLSGESHKTGLKDKFFKLVLMRPILIDL